MYSPVEQLKLFFFGFLFQENVTLGVTPFIAVRHLLDVNVGTLIFQREYM